MKCTAQQFSAYPQDCITLAAAAAAKSLQSCPTLCNPIDGSPPGSATPGILQARTLEWVAISLPLSNYRTFLSPQKGKSYPLAVTVLSLLPCSLATANLLSLRLSILDLVYKWNHIVCCPLCLATFTYHTVFRVHPCCSMYHYFFPFYGKMILQYMDAISRWAFRFFSTF